MPDEIHNFTATGYLVGPDGDFLRDENDKLIFNPMPMMRGHLKSCQPHENPLTPADNSIDIEIEQLEQFYGLCGERMMSMTILTQRGIECKLDSRAVSGQLAVNIKPVVLELIRNLKETRRKGNVEKRRNPQRDHE